MPLASPPSPFIRPSVEDLAESALQDSTIFPVTLLCQGEGAAYEHQFHPPSAQLYDATPAHHAGLRQRHLNGRAFGVEVSAEDGYCATCDLCMDAQRRRAAADDVAFGDLLSSNHRFSASRFAPPRLRALVSTPFPDEELAPRECVIPWCS